MDSAGAVIELLLQETVPSKPRCRGSVLAWLLGLCCVGLVSLLAWDCGSTMVRGPTISMSPRPRLPIFAESTLRRANLHAGVSRLARAKVQLNQAGRASDDKPYVTVVGVLKSLVADPRAKHLEKKLKGVERELKQRPTFGEIRQVFLLLPIASIAHGIGAGSAHAAGSTVGFMGNADWRFFLAGGLAAACSHGYTTPIDVVKTRMQTNPELYNGNVQIAIERISREEGPAFLLQGLAPTALGYGLEGALKFGFYESFKPVFMGLTPNLGDLNFVLASVVAGMAAAVVLCPAEDVRIRLVADPEFAPGPLAALFKVIRAEGPWSSFRGLNAMLAKQVPYTATKQVSFDVFETMLRKMLPSVCELYPAVPALAASSLTAVLSCFASHPGDMLLTATFKEASQTNGSRGTGQIFDDIVKQYGPGGLFLGIQARMGHVIAIVTPQLVIYDTCKQLLGLPATGSR